MNTYNRRNTALRLPNPPTNSLDNAREDSVQSQAEIPHEFRCPISRELFDDPVVAADGYSYERAYIEYFASQTRTARQGDGSYLFLSPVTREMISTTFYSNRFLKEALSAWQFKEKAYERKFQSMEEEMKSIELAFQLYWEMLDEKQRVHPRAFALESDLSAIELRFKSDVSAAREKGKETLSISTHYFGELVVFLESVLKTICLFRKLTTNSSITLGASIALLRDAEVISPEESETLHEARDQNNKAKHSIHIKPTFSEDHVNILATVARNLLRLLKEPQPQSQPQPQPQPQPQSQPQSQPQPQPQPRPQAVEAEAAVGGRMAIASTSNTNTALAVKDKSTISDERATVASARGSPSRSSEGFRTGGAAKPAPSLTLAPLPPPLLLATPSLSPIHPPADPPHPLQLRDAVESDCPDYANSLGKRKVYLALCNTLIEEIRSYMSRGGGPLPVQRARSFLLLQEPGQTLNNSIIIIKTLQNGEIPSYVRDFMVENRVITDEEASPITFARGFQIVGSFLFVSNVAGNRDDERIEFPCELKPLRTAPPSTGPQF